MKRYAVTLAVAVLFLFAPVAVVFSSDIVWEETGRGNLDLGTVLVNPDNPGVIYIGSGNAVLKSVDGGANWRNILSVSGKNKSVNFLSFAAADKNSLYAATGNGLFYSANQGRDWKRIFKGRNYLENECLTVAALPAVIYLGTKAGLFMSRDRGRSWYKQRGELGNSNLLAIAYNLREPECVYLACAAGVFRSRDSGDSWEKVFSALPAQSGEDNHAEEEAEYRDEEERVSQIRYISCVPGNLSSLYLATSRGIYRSENRGDSWEGVSSYGLLSRDIKFLFVSDKSRIYAAAKSGIFEYQGERWQELSLGLSAEEVRFLASDSRNNLYAACDNGLFKTTNPDYGKGADITLLYREDEPDINEVQRAAIKYAEVEPEKIMRWRRQARMKAILPKLTVGLDKSERTNYEIYTSASTRYVYEGPRDKSNGWDVTLSWELGDLIWNDDQTSIDVRSRLMVQLRDDILDEVTKLYFERIRIKMELGSLPIEDRKKRFEKELKLQELTASLDGLTGGYFSSQLP